MSRLAAFLGFACAFLCQDNPKKEADLGEALVLTTEGDVEFRRPDKTKKWAKLEKDAKLQGGDQVQTGLKSRCLLKIGEATRVLIRSSSFATLTRSFVEKNKVDAEVRLDVGSVFIDIDEKRTEQVEFKVSTPTATASIRGTFVVVVTGEMGSNIVQRRGKIGAGNDTEPETSLDDRAPFRWFPVFGHSEVSPNGNANGDPSADPTSSRGLSAIGPDPSFRGTQDFTQNGQRLGGNPDCGPVSTGLPDTLYRCSPFVQWAMHFDPGVIVITPSTFVVTPLTRLVGVRTVGTSSFGTVRGTDVFSLQNLSTINNPPDWRLNNLQANRQYQWDNANKVWIPQ